MSFFFLLQYLVELEWTCEMLRLFGKENTVGFGTTKRFEECHRVATRHI